MTMHLTNVIKTSITIVSINNNNNFKQPGHSISFQAWLNNDYVSSHLTNVIKTSITIVSINNNNIFKHPGHSVL